MGDFRMNKRNLYQTIAGLNLVLIFLGTGITATLVFWKKTYGFGVIELVTSLAGALILAVLITRWQTGRILQSINEIHISQDRDCRVEKHTAVSHLGAGIADKIRNPLTSIKGFTVLLQDQVKASERSRSYTNIILQEVSKIERIINNFLLLSKPPHPMTGPVNINRLIDELLPGLVTRAVLQKVKIATSYDDQLPVVQADAGQIKHVIGNLAGNALDAMPNGGQLRIETGYDVGRCNIVIADTGGGIPPEHIERVAEPFYTTKDDGIGLGLTVSQQIIINHEGSLDIETRRGRGMIFRINLPAFGRGSKENVPA